MANRTILGAFDGTFVLRTSRPGYNVLDPNLPSEAVSFDSRWNKLGRVVSSGTTQMYLQYVDMLGIIWTGEFYTVPNLVTAPTAIVQVKPNHFSNRFAAYAHAGELFAGGYDPASGFMGIEAAAIWSETGVPYTNNSQVRWPFGIAHYWVLAAE